MNEGKSEAKRKNLIRLLESISPSRERNLTREELMKKAIALATVEEYCGDLESVVDEVMTRRDIHMPMGESIVAKAEHDRDWVRRLQIDDWHYHEAYDRYLAKQDWPPRVARSVINVNRRILGHLQDPTSGGSWDRRGMVIGHVQSGKTANYIGLMAAAADAGYKFIVVIAGIHNNLRKQTQERVDEGFVGKARRHGEKRIDIGVGMEPGYPHPVSITHAGIKGDFDKKIADSSGWKLNDFSKPITVVIKKNVNVLKALLNWLKDMNGQGGGISDVPMLLIDDEADHASINTNKDELDPTKTNSLIRQILAIFAKSSYVGYTATPFANIFIHPKAYDEEARQDLFPRHFIYSLDPPNNYFGPDKVFPERDGENVEPASDILRPILDCEDCIPLSHKEVHDIGGLPPSLRRAICIFVVARAIRNLRGGVGRHCSMMINVSRFVKIQKTVAEFVSVYVSRLQKEVRLYYRMPDDAGRDNEYMRSLKEAFSMEYAATCQYDWEKVKSGLDEVLQELRIFVVNSKSDETLDYTKYEKDGSSLTAIAIGGLSLSRGLTIKGLCVSYMYRNTRTYDTLMQMARWFGYPGDYQDLCRVYLSEDSINWYGYISRVTEELRDQIRLMRIDDRTPEDFGLYVRRHPDALLITAQGKMRAGQRVKVKQDYSGRLVESPILSADEVVNERNEALIARYWQSEFGGIVEKIRGEGRKSKGWQVLDAPVDEVRSFLVEFKVHLEWQWQKDGVLSYLERIMGTYPTADVLMISIKDNNEDASEFRLGSQLRDKTAKLDTEQAFLRLRKNRVGSRGDERLGLTTEQQEAAEREARKAGKTDQVSDVFYRKQRRKPLLMVHVLSHGDGRYPAFGISFPSSTEGQGVEIEVVGNPRYIELMRGFNDDPDKDDHDS